MSCNSASASTPISSISFAFPLSFALCSPVSPGSTSFSRNFFPFFTRKGLEILWPASMTCLRFIGCCSVIESIGCSVGQPRPRFGLACFGKKFHGTFADPRAGERQDLGFPDGMTNDRDFSKVLAMGEKEVGVPPLLVALPTDEVFQDDQKLDGTGGHFLHDFVLHGIELGFFQLAPDAKDEKAITLLFKISAHG